ncbi:MAG: toxin-antitoxin system HicB family antitoxin [Deltaproteobacteria bacterium]
MKKEKAKRSEKEKTQKVDKKLPDKSTALKKKQKNKTPDKMPAPAPKVAKSKFEKVPKKTVEPKKNQSPMDDKKTKFLVSMKKSLRKNIKKEAAEAGISMNEYILLAVEEKLLN